MKDIDTALVAAAGIVSTAAVIIHGTPMNTAIVATMNTAIVATMTFALCFLINGAKLQRAKEARAHFDRTAKSRHDSHPSN